MGLNACSILFNSTPTKKRKFIKYWATQDSNSRRLEKNRSRESEKYAGRPTNVCKKFSHQINGHSFSRSETSCAVAVEQEEKPGPALRDCLNCRGERQSTQSTEIMGGSEIANDAVADLHVGAFIHDAAPAKGISNLGAALLRVKLAQQSDAVC